MRQCRSGIALGGLQFGQHLVSLYVVRVAIQTLRQQLATLGGTDSHQCFQLLTLGGRPEGLDPAELLDRIGRQEEVVDAHPGAFGELGLGVTLETPFDFEQAGQRLPKIALPAFTLGEREMGETVGQKSGLVE